MAVRGVSPLLVGRRDELALVLAAVARAAAGDCGVMLVGGEAGVGKSRLVAEAARQAAESGVRVVTGACVEGGGEGMPFAPIVDVLRGLARTTPSAGPGRAARPGPTGRGAPAA